MATTQKLSAELEISAGLSAGFSRAFDRLDAQINKTVRGLKGFSDKLKGVPDGERITGSLGRGFDKLTSIFRNTNSEIGRTHDNISALKKQGRIYESLAEEARKMGKAVQPWLEKIDRVNTQLDKQERKLNQLRIARERLDRASRGFATVRERAAPIARRAGYGALAAGIGTGYAAARGFQTYTDFDVTLQTLKAEGVAETDIPAIRDQILKFAGETRFTALEIGELLVSMKKDGQEITSELLGFGDLLKFAVAENKDINTAWDVTRTYINATNTSLEKAVRLQEELSNATSLSKLQIEDYGFIAGKALSTFANLENFDSRGFNAIAGLLADTGVQAETVGITLRRFPLVLAEAAHGKLGGEKQGLFDALGINIANEQGQLKDIVTILSDFNRVFTERGFITDENKISTLGLTQLGGIFDTRYADAIGKMITGYQKIEENIEGVGKIGTLDEKFDVHTQTLFASQKRFASAVESFGLRLFGVFDDDDNFIKMFDGMTEGVNRFVRFIEKHKDSISSFARGFVDVLGDVGEAAFDLGAKVFAYFQERGPAIKAFIKDFWEDLKGVWKTLKPIVDSVIGAFGILFDTVGKFAGGNTKLLAWLTAAFIGWKTLKTPVLALNSAFNLVVGSIGKVKAAWTGLQGLETLDTVGDVIPSRGKDPKPKVQRWGAPLAADAVTMAPVKRGPWGTAIKKAPKLGPWQKFLGIFTKLGTAVTSFGTRFIGIFAGLGPVVAWLGTKLSFLLPVVGILGKAFAAVGTVIAGITAPVWAVVGVIVAAVAGGVALIVSQWDKVKNAISETWDSFKVFTSLVWEGFKWLGGTIGSAFGSIFGYTDKILKKFGIDIVGIFTGLGDFFKGLFGGIWSGIKGIWDGIKGFGKFLSDQFGKLMDFVSTLNDTFQKFVGGWRDFFKKENDERKREKQLAAEKHTGGIKVALPEPVTPLVKDATATVNVDTPIVAIETATPDALKIPVSAETPQFPTMEAGTFEMNIEKPIMPNLELPDTTQKITQNIESPEMPSLESIQADINMPQMPKLDSIETKITTPDMPALEMPTSQLQTVQRDTIEYVNFKGVDELDTTIKSGFTSLIHINDQILLALVGKYDNKKEKKQVLLSLDGDKDNKRLGDRKDGRVEAPNREISPPVFPEIKTPNIPGIEVNDPIVQTPPLPDIRTPEIDDLNIIEPTLPDLKVPVIEELAVQESQVYASVGDVPDMKIEDPGIAQIDAPVLPEIQTPVLPDLRTEDPGIAQIDAPVLPELNTPSMEDVSITEPTLPELKVPAIDELKIEQLHKPVTVDESPFGETLPELNLQAMDSLTVQESQVFATFDEIPSLAIDAPNLDTLDAPYIRPLEFQKPPYLETEPFPKIGLDSPDLVERYPKIEIPEPQTINTPALHQTTNNNSESRDENVEITNNITINQQPGEDAEALTARVLGEIERQGRTRYYD